MQFTTYNYYYKLLSTPHLLVAGSTGSGKSVILNGLIYTALLHRENRLILIDPKQVELNEYSKLPQVLKHADTDKEIIKALQWSLDTMLKRFKTMKRKHQKQSEEQPIYIFIDEFADLMTTNKKDLQPLLFRLSQLGRAANIHLILATQRPTRDIINGQIKVNIDCRVALRCPSPQDSRNIIDRAGAETLPKWGECLFLSADGLERLAVPMIPQEEINRLIKYKAG